MLRQKKGWETGFLFKKQQVELNIEVVRETKRREIKRKDS